MGQTNPIFTYKVEKKETDVLRLFGADTKMGLLYGDIECSYKPLSKALIQRN